MAGLWCSYHDLQVNQLIFTLRLQVNQYPVASQFARSMIPITSPQTKLHAQQHALLCLLTSNIFQLRSLQWLQN